MVVLTRLGCRQRSTTLCLVRARHPHSADLGQTKYDDFGALVWRVVVSGESRTGLSSIHRTLLEELKL